MSVTPTTRMVTTSQTQKSLAAIILAAGSGQRMGDGLEKQFRPLAGKPVLIHSVTAFLTHPACARIVIVCALSQMEKVRTMSHCQMLAILISKVSLHERDTLEKFENERKNYLCACLRKCAISCVF